MSGRHWLAALGAVFLASIIVAPAHAEGMRKPSTGGSLDILVDPTWSGGGQASFKISFLKPGTDAVEPHIDYDFVITDSAGNRVYSAAKQLNQPVLHTEPSVVTIPYRFSDNGSYTLTVEVYGIFFTPITPESAEFSINVTPEFPAGMLLAVVAAMSAAIVASRWFRKP